MVGEVCKAPIYLANASLYVVKWGVNRMNKSLEGLLNKMEELVFSVVFILGQTL